MATQIKGLAVKGLAPDQDHDLSANDTPPNAVNVWFDVDDVYMPVIVNDQGEIIREEKWEKFVFFNFEYDMGFCAGRQRVRDKLKFNESSGRWEVIRLAPGDQSHIRRYPDQWNAFYEGLNYNEIGTPLEVIYPRDRGFVKHLNKIGIFTVERLGAITEGEAQLGGMGVLDAKRKAMAFLERLEDSRATREVEAHVNALEAYKSKADREIEELKKTVQLLIAEKEGEKPEAQRKIKKKQNLEPLEAS